MPSPFWETTDSAFAGVSTVITHIFDQNFSLKSRGVRALSLGVSCAVCLWKETAFSTEKV